jgi:hypothetical protein
MQSRRDILKLLGVSVGALGLSATAAAEGLAAFADASGQAGAPLWLVAPLQPGSPLGKGWTLTALSPVERGAAVLTLQHRAGQLARVHLCARDGRPKGLTHTALFDLLLMDGGQGDRPTDEGLGRALVNLASRVKHNELGSADLRVRGLLSHLERVERFGPEALV